MEPIEIKAKTLSSAEPAFSSRQEVVVVMPAYNAAKTLAITYQELPHERIRTVILVDDGSRDETVQIARQLGIKIFVHSGNFGYGANQKTCYSEALKTQANIIVMVHPDYQYDPKLLPELIRPIEKGEADVVFGSRMLGVSAYKQGMPWWKYIANRFLTWVENQAFGLFLSEFHTGYRAYSREVLERVNYRANSDSFIFDQEVVAQIVECKFRIAEVSVPVRYFPEASSANFYSSVIYGLGILRLVLRYYLHKRNILPSIKFISITSRYREL